MDDCTWWSEPSLVSRFLVEIHWNWLIKTLPNSSEHFQTREIVNIGFLVNSKKCLILYSRGQGNFINDQITNPCISCHCQLNTIKQIFTQQLFCWCDPLSMQILSPLFYCPTSCYATLLFTETHQLMQYKSGDILRHWKLLGFIKTSSLCQPGFLENSF